jgi:hypothetical protein
LVLQGTTDWVVNPVNAELLAPAPDTGLQYFDGRVILL